MTLVNITQGMRLNVRESQILDGLAHGLTARKIGARLHLSADTVRTYQARIRVKLGARNAAHCVALGFERGYLTVRTGVPAR